MKKNTPKRPQVEVARKVHPVYEARLSGLEAMGIDLERIITIAHNAVWDVGTVLPSMEPPKDHHGHYHLGASNKAVALVASAEYCRETWEKYHRTDAGPTLLWDDARERVKARVEEYLSKMERKTETA